MSVRFPQPLPGETWQSAVARFLSPLSKTARWRCASNLLGSPTAAVAYDFPQSLERTVGGLPSALRIDVVSVVEKHSMFPLFRPFLPDAKVRAAINGMSGAANLHLLLGSGPSRIRRPRGLRVCRKCVRADIENFGCAYWHRQHQAPGVLFCATHGVGLCETDALAVVSAATEIQTADSAVVGGRICKASAPLLEIAKDIAAFLDAALWPVDLIHLNALYRARLDSLGLLTRFGRFAFTEIMQQFLARFPAADLRSIGAGLKCHDRDNWLSRLFRKPEELHSPIQHLLVMRFLGLEALGTLTTGLDRSRTCAIKPSRRCAASRGAAPPERVRRKREQWMRLVRRNPFGSLRARNDALYCWLWRNDHEWLRAQARTAPRIGARKVAHEGDRRIAAKIERTAMRLRRRPTPIRLSRRRLARSSGWLKLERDIPSLPMATAAIRRSVENATEFACRKVVEYGSRLPATERRTSWRVVRAAGLAASTARKPPVRRAISRIMESRLP